MPKSSNAQPQPELRFEDAVERLEEIIGRMETERVPLDELLGDYEEGTKLLKTCRARIDAARERVETINKDLAKARPDGSGDETGEPAGVLDDDDDTQLL